MAAIRMTKGGAAMHAYDLGEVERLKGLGWSVEGEKVAAPIVAGDPPETVPGPAVDAAVVSLAEKRKPGRPKLVK